MNSSDLFPRPCVNGSSGPEFYFNYSIQDSNFKNLTGSEINNQPEASIFYPILFSLAGILGQLCALVILHHPSTRPSNSRTTFYVMLSTLIWTDLVGKLITTPLPVTAYSKGHWFGGALSCNVHGYSMSLIGLVTHMLVAIMAFERYLGIRCGYFYVRYITTFRTRIALLSLWCFGLLYCCLPFLGVGQFKLHYPGTWCHINQHLCPDQPLRHRIYGNLYSTINLICLFFMVSCNSLVVGTLLKMRMTAFRPSKSMLKDTATKKPPETEIQMVILLLVITVTFVFSWIGHDLLMIKNQIWPPSENENPTRDLKAIRLVSLNQIIDPWSYIIFRIVFRSKVWKCCLAVLIGKLHTRRFSNVNKFDTVSTNNCNEANIHKRSSLPNIGHTAAKFKTENLSIDERKSSSDNSVPDNLSRGRKGKFLQRLAPQYKEKSKAIRSTLAMIFNSTKDNKTYIQIDPPEDMPQQSPNHQNLNSLSPSCIARNFPLGSSFNGYTKKINEAADDPSELLLHLRGVKLSTKSVTGRSNSWCCTDEYTRGIKL